MRLSWSAPAEDDLQRIYEFNLSRSEAWAEHVEARVRLRADDLTAAPSSGRPAGGPHLRALSIPDIQYVVQYRLDGELLTILRVLSTREIE